MLLLAILAAQVALGAFGQPPSQAPPGSGGVSVGSTQAASPSYFAARPLGTPASGAVGAQTSGYAQGLTKPPFSLGSATAAYQVEGAAARDGRLPSIWDTYAKTPGKVANGDNGDTADDFYDRFPDDIATAKALGTKTFRFSISWSRVLPSGSGAVNQLGLNFYSSLIDSLLAAGLEPHITHYHWDLPQALQDAYGGWLNPQSVTDFTNYADVVFQAFAGRVKHWTTFNELQTWVQLGYNLGSFAPGRCSNRTVCSDGDSTTEPWTVLRNALLAHGYAAQRLRSYAPDALISCNFNINWALPLDPNSADDQAAVQRYLDWHLGLYADPLFTGQFPASVVAAGIPGIYFNATEQSLLRGSANYFALNHYTTSYVTSWSNSTSSYRGSLPGEVNVQNDPRCGNTETYSARDGVPIGPQAESSWLFTYPQGLYSVLKYIDAYYGHPKIYITECGTSVPNESSLPLQQALNDTFRISYFQGYVQAAIQAAQEGVQVQSFFAWSLLDNFEWLEGFSTRFGIIHVDYSNNLARYAKESAKFLAAWFQGGPTPSGAVASASIG